MQTGDRRANPRGVYLVGNANDIPGIDSFQRWDTWTKAVAGGFLQHDARTLPAGGHDLGSAVGVGAVQRPRPPSSDSGFISHHAKPLPAAGHDLGSALAQALSSI